MPMPNCKREQTANRLQKVIDTLDRLELLIQKLKSGEITPDELTPLDSNLSLSQAMNKDLKLVSKGGKA
jgi:hypothetical protein